VEGTPSASFLARHEFLIRRLHSLSGLLPVGFFLCMHLVTNASVLAGPGVFQGNVDRIHALGPLLPAVEWTFIFLPLIFHAVVGAMIASSAQFNTGAYRYGSNVRYFLQRATAWIALVFIAYHVFHMHGWVPNEAIREKIRATGFGAQFSPEHATSTAAVALQSFALIAAYAIGVLACVYHLANGLWTMGITWGVWTTPAGQRRANYVCLVFGLALSAAGLGSLVGMVTADVPMAKAVEQVRIEQHEAKQSRESELRKQLEEEMKPETAATQGGSQHKPAEAAAIAGGT